MFIVPNHYFERAGKATAPHSLGCNGGWSTRFIPEEPLLQVASITAHDYRRS